jgi:hypothetical protein
MNAAIAVKISSAVISSPFRRYELEIRVSVIQPVMTRCPPITAPVFEAIPCGGLNFALTFLAVFPR